MQEHVYIDVAHPGNMLASEGQMQRTCADNATEVSPMSHRPHALQQMVAENCEKFREVSFAHTNGSACGPSTSLKNTHFFTVFF